jgi:hypothetical protein
MITEPPEDIMLRHGDWLRLVGPWALPKGWLSVARRMLDSMADVARKHRISITVGPLNKDLFEIGVEWSAKAAPEEVRSKLAEAVRVARLRSQAVCETCGQRGFMRRDSARHVFQIACDGHGETGSQRLADQTIAENWTDGKRIWRRVYDAETDCVSDDEQTPL